MTLPDGQYTLKATPFAQVYATINGLDKIVTITERNPSTAERQIVSTLGFSSTFLLLVGH